MLSADGYFAGPNGEIDWHHVDQEFNDFAIAQLKTAGAFIFGRKTYELMASYWPSVQPKKDDPIVAGFMNGLPKYVFSKTLDSASWANTNLFREIDPAQIQNWKGQSEKDIFIFGSGMIVQALTNLNLIDKYNLMINPVILGRGKLLFENIKERVSLNLLDSKKFKSGNVLLRYSRSK
jgi:dihydrofolate reductase